MTSLPAHVVPVVAGDPSTEVRRRLSLDHDRPPSAPWVDLWPEDIARAIQVERLVSTIVQHLLKERLGVFGELDTSGWLWSSEASRRLDALDLALERSGAHPGGGRQ